MSEELFDPYAYRDADVRVQSGKYRVTTVNIAKGIFLVEVPFEQTTEYHERCTAMLFGMQCRVRGKHVRHETTMSAPVGRGIDGAPLRMSVIHVEFWECETDE